MKTISLRRQAGLGGKGAWVRNEDTGEFVRYARITHTAGSGNQTLEWDLDVGKYTIQEKWYGKVTRQTIEVSK